MCRIDTSKNDYNKQAACYLIAFEQAAGTRATQVEISNAATRIAVEMFGVKARRLRNNPRHPEVIIRQWSNLGLIEEIDAMSNWRLTLKGRTLLKQEVALPRPRKPKKKAA